MSHCSVVIRTSSGCGTKAASSSSERSISLCAGAVCRCAGRCASAYLNLPLADQTRRPTPMSSTGTAISRATPTAGPSGHLACGRRLRSRPRPEGATSQQIDGGYSDYHPEMTGYANILAGPAAVQKFPARRLAPSANPKVFNYVETASDVSGSASDRRLVNERVAIIDVGDRHTSFRRQETPVREIHCSTTTSS